MSGSSNWNEVGRPEVVVDQGMVIAWMMGNKRYCKRKGVMRRKIFLSNNSVLAYCIFYPTLKTFKEQGPFLYPSFLLFPSDTEDPGSLAEFVGSVFLVEQIRLEVAGFVEEEYGMMGENPVLPGNI